LRASLLSFCYRTTRFIVTKILYFYQAIFFKPRDLEPAIKFGDIILSAITGVGAPIYNFKIPAGNTVDIFELKFSSPLIGASFKSETDVLDLWLRMGLGSITFKTITKDARLGNDKPRIQDISLNGDKGLFNSMGLPGQGVQLFSSQIPHSKLWDYDRPLGISIGGNTIQEYFENIKGINKSLTGLTRSYYFELNISCPNTENGRTLGDDPLELERLLTQVRAIINVPMCVKVSPDSSDELLNQIGEICQGMNRVFINAGNTQLKTPLQVGLKPSQFSKPKGGLSGTPIFDRTLEMVKLFSNYEIPIIATGGISNIHHVRTLKNAGATLYGMATALVFDPYCIPKINKYL
jgi:dihydroorotate dehydrogenase